MSFFYRYGEVETDISWNRPTWETFYAWWEEFKLEEGVSDYECYISGSSLVDIENTWDVDVIITGPIKDFVVLNNIIRKGREMGFSKKIYIDICYYDSIEFCYYELEEENIRWYLKGHQSGEELKIVDGVITIKKVLGYNGLTPFNQQGSKMVFYYTKQPTKKNLDNKGRYHPTNRAKKLV